MSNSSSSWMLPDELWEYIKPLIPKHPPSPKGGRPRANDRHVADAIFFLLKTGSQWKCLPHFFGVSSSVVHQRFKEWTGARVFSDAWKNTLKTLDKANGVKWRWQAADGAMTKAPLGGEGTGHNPTDRAKLGTKRCLLTDQNGIPLSIIATGANRHDMKMLRDTLDEIIIKKPSGKTVRQGLCLDKGFDYPELHSLIKKKHYNDHIKTRSDEIKMKKRNPRYKARRWVVERTHSWLNRFRRILIRWEKKLSHYLSFLSLACALIVVRAI